jgi:hypothetical protein
MIDFLQIAHKDGEQFGNGLVIGIGGRNFRKTGMHWFKSTLKK